MARGRKRSSGTGGGGAPRGHSTNFVPKHQLVRGFRICAVSTAENQRVAFVGCLGNANFQEGVGGARAELWSPGSYGAGRECQLAERLPTNWQSTNSAGSCSEDEAVTTLSRRDSRQKRSGDRRRSVWADCHFAGRVPLTWDIASLVANCQLQAQSVHRRGVGNIIFQILDNPGGDRLNV